MNQQLWILNLKIIDAYHSESISQRQLAKRFNIAKSFIQKLLKQYRETGDVQPKPHGGGTDLKLTSKHQIILLEIVEENNDATLEELCQLLKAKNDATTANNVKRKQFIPQKKKVKKYKN